jgi:hypothetical protein
VHWRGRKGQLCVMHRHLRTGTRVGEDGGGKGACGRAQALRSAKQAGRARAHSNLATGRLREGRIERDVVRVVTRGAQVFCRWTHTSVPTRTLSHSHTGTEAPLYYSLCPALSLSLSLSLSSIY